MNYKKLFKWNYKPGDRISIRDLQASVDAVLVKDIALAKEIKPRQCKAGPISRNKVGRLLRLEYVTERCKIPDPTGRFRQLNAYLITAVRNGNGEPLPAPDRLTFFNSKPPAVSRTDWRIAQKV